MYLLLLLPLLLCHVAAAGKLLGGDKFGLSYMALQSDGQVYGWGSSNGNGMLGVGSESMYIAYPTQVLNVSYATDLSIGYFYSCIVDLGQAKCIGGGSYLGRSSTKSNSRFLVNVEGLGDDATQVSQLFAGGRHACLITIAGAVWCWGDAQSGELANSATVSMSAPGRVTGYGADKVGVVVVTGDFHSCVLFDYGTVGCAGWNGSGQLGVGDVTDRYK